MNVVRVGFVRKSVYHLCNKFKKKTIGHLKNVSKLMCFIYAQLIGTILYLYFYSSRLCEYWKMEMY